MSDDTREDVRARLRTRHPFPFGRMAPDRSFAGGPTSLPTIDDGTLPVETSERVRSTRGVTGPRGRDVSGQPVSIPAGQPPAHLPGGWGSILDLLTKEDQRPIIPPQFERYLDVLITANSGILLDRSLGFPCRGMHIDNNSKIWLYIPALGRYIMPYITGVAYPVHTAPNKIVIQASAPPGITQPAAIAAPNQQAFSVYCSEDTIECSPGVPVTNAGALP